MTPAPEAPVSCAGCGCSADGPDPTWSCSFDARGTTWLCQACTRQNLRAIEGRLDEAWW